MQPHAGLQDRSGEGDGTLTRLEQKNAVANLEQLPEAERAKDPPPKVPEGMQPCPQLGFRHPASNSNARSLSPLQSTHFVVLCYSRHGKLIQYDIIGNVSICIFMNFNTIIFPEKKNL